jgi:UDP-N-acetylmuramoyl-tripeptide--D-alanyl-D-alanine ligase
MDEEGKACGVIEINGRQHEILLNLYGKHHIQNASSALCSLLPFDIDIGRAVEDLKNFRGMSNRSNVSRFRNFILINDCYNASPLSMKAAVDLLKSIKSAGRKIACIGDMAELGEFSEKAHREIGNLIAENHIDFLFAVGKEAEKYAEGAVESGMKKDNIFSFSDITEIKEIFNKLVQDDDVILLKGSRIKKMERLLDILME